MVDYLDAVIRNSQRFADVLEQADLAAPVPSCPDWTIADLAWHLAEVHQFWAYIAGELATDPSTYPEPTRVADDRLHANFVEQSTRLIEVLRNGNPDDACWSWHQGGGSVGWVLRRQAHEALIHRVDMELAAGEHSPIDPDLAADGVDEILMVMIDGLPDWASFEPNDTRAAIETRGRRWTLQFGQFTGTSTRTGKSYDEEIMQVVDAGDVAATISGDPVAVDLWLWGRAPATELTVTGDLSLVDKIRAMAAEDTQ